MNLDDLNDREICLIGTNITITRQLIKKGFLVNQFGRNTSPSIDFEHKDLKEKIKKIIDMQSTNKYLIISGFLQSKKIFDQNKEEISKSFFVNAVGAVLFAEYLFSQKPNARLIIIGSESGFKGSFDLSYALSKSSLKLYVQQKKLKVNQQILLLSPSTIDNFGMTLRRTDKDNLKKYKENHPKKRFLNSSELIDLIINLFASTSYLTNIEISVNGGKFCLME
tara:strand:+ start:218 stop:886 length:669 start_codon:yes stop_codon:yes gene_type:complete